MFNQSEVQCWEIIQCNKKQDCFLREDADMPCWEAVAGDNACSFHICVDCLVYLAKHENSLLSHKQLCLIMAKRKEKGIRPTECHFISSAKN